MYHLILLGPTKSCTNQNLGVKLENFLEDQDRGFRGVNAAAAKKKVHSSEPAEQPASHDKRRPLSVTFI